MKPSFYLTHGVVLLIGLLIPSVLSAQVKKEWITAYTDDFSGNHYDLGPGRYDNVYLLESGLSQINSIKVPEGMMAILYSGENFDGYSIALTKDADKTFLESKGFAKIELSVSLVVQKAPAAKAAPAPNGPVATIYKDNFTGDSKTLVPGEYEFTDFEIGNDQLSSIKVPKGLKVTIYEDQAFGGRSLVLTKDASADFLISNKFNDVTSSLIVETLPAPTQVVTPVAPADPTPTPQPVVVVIVEEKQAPTPAPVVTPVAPVVVEVPEPTGPFVTIYQGDFSGVSKNLVPGNYRADELGIGNDELSSVKVPKGLRVTLYDQGSFDGRSLILTRDTHTDFLSANGFNNATSSLVIDVAPVAASLPSVTIYENDFSGVSKNLTPGKYEVADIGIGNNTLSSIRIPRGLRATLYEYGGFEGRTLVTQKDIDQDFLKANDFDDLATSIMIEQVPSAELQVTIFADSYSGLSQTFVPGRYNTADLGIGNDHLTSAMVPKGMRATLFEDGNFMGRSVTLEANADFAVSKTFNDRTSSMIVEDIFVPIVTPVAAKPTTTVTATPVVKEVETVPVVEIPPCEMNETQYRNAYNAVKSKAFRDEKMTTARLATKDKCMSNEQIRGIAKLFSFEDQTLEFVKYAYDLSNEKSEYYTLADIFKFLSSKDEFNKFLSAK